MMNFLLHEKLDRVVLNLPHSREIKGD